MYEIGLLMKIGFRKSFSTLIRPLIIADAEACSKIHGDAFQHGWSVSEFERMFLDSGVIGDGCFASGKSSPSSAKVLYGFAVSRLIAGEAEILTIAVNRASRRNHVATGLLADHIAALQRAGSRKLFLEVAEDNAPALGLYRKFNFHKVGDRPDYYRRQGEKPVNAHILLLEI